MRPPRSNRAAIAAAILGTAIAAPARAAGMPVFDAALLAAVTSLTASVTAMNTSVSNLLYNMGMAVNQNGQKVASTVEATAKAQREFDTVQQTNRLLEDARQHYEVPGSICAESGSAGAGAIADYAHATRSSLRPAGGAAIGNAGIAQAVNAPAVSQAIDASRAAKIHAQFCDADDHAAFGGAQACPQVSTRMPGADKRFDTVQTGAGPNGKKPDLTFSAEQTDAARMYLQNAVRRSVGPQLHRIEADTAAGAQYIGLMNQYSAVVSAAADPLEQRIADSQSNPVTKALLQDALKVASAAAYFNTMASSRAKSTGTMSAREFETFEVGRRYANTAYQSDLQAMAGDNLLRELIRVNTLNNWLLLSLKNEVQKGTIISGITLASQAHQEYEPLLAQKYRSIPGRTGQ